MSDKLNEVWEWLRLFGTEQDKTRFRPVYKHIEVLEKKVRDLEAALSEYTAPQFFPRVKSKITSEDILKSATENMARMRGERGVYAPLKDRIKEMIKEGKTGSDEWLLTLKWNKLNHDEAMKMGGSDGEDSGV